MCTVQEFLAVFAPHKGPIELGSIWIDRNGYKCQVINSTDEKVEVIKETNFKYCSGRGFNKFGEFSLDLFLHIFDPVLE